MIFRIILLLCVLCGSVQAQTVGNGVTPPTPVTLKQPCDLLVNGCLSAYSVVQRMAASYGAALFQLYCSDGTSTAVWFRSRHRHGQDQLALHAFCDGYDCFVQFLYDQGSAGNLMSNTTAGVGITQRWGGRPMVFR